ncbi:methyltransferase domain-containing protein [Candidatus Saccharibacteria bacterium]|nr:methyltransferase domain-containing protein [candidate division Zixibacteria bacterium]NIT04129.1 methyltransferase domain-containing protein [Candidatus Saccharibacteria bacterium]
MDRRSYKWFYDNIHSRYYDLAMKWCFLPFGGEKRCRRQLIAYIDFSPGERILEMCCGTGGATFVIAEKAGETCEIIGMDLSRGQIRVAGRKNRFGHVRFMQGDVVNTGFDGAYFDKVFITHALHEMTRETRLKVLTEAKRILKERGEVIVLEVDNPESFFVRLFIGFWFFYWLPFNFETPTRRDMLKHGLVNEVRKVGFNNVGKISKYRGVLQIVSGER